jgi:hypothetical protein
MCSLDAEHGQLADYAALPGSAFEEWWKRVEDLIVRADFAAGLLTFDSPWYAIFPAGGYLLIHVIEGENRTRREPGATPIEHPTFFANP